MISISSSSRFRDKNSMCSCHLSMEVCCSFCVSISHHDSKSFRSVGLLVLVLMISAMLLSDAMYRSLWFSAYVRISGISCLYFSRDCWIRSSVAFGLSLCIYFALYLLGMKSGYFVVHSS